VDGWLKEWVTRGFEALELRLTRESGTGRFTHGDALSLADCCLVPQCYAARRFGVDPADFPNISRIERACAEIEAFRRAAPDDQADRE
jgi:glutathione S-transferase